MQRISVSYTWSHLSYLAWLTVLWKVTSEPAWFVMHNYPLPEALERYCTWGTCLHNGCCITYIYCTHAPAAHPECLSSQLSFIAVVFKAYLGGSWLPEKIVQKSYLCSTCTHSYPAKLQHQNHTEQHTTDNKINIYEKSTIQLVSTQTLFTQTLLQKRKRGSGEYSTTSHHGLAVANGK